MTTVQLKNDEFLHLLEGGFFMVILKHPEVELWRDRDGGFYMWIPGHGAVGVSAKDEDGPGEKT